MAEARPGPDHRDGRGDGDGAQQGLRHSQVHTTLSTQYPILKTYCSLALIIHQKWLKLHDITAGWPAPLWLPPCSGAA